MIDWGAFLVVAVVSIASAAALVGLYSLGLRLLAVDPRPTVVTVGAYACFVIAAVGALYGVYLIIPTFHGG
ncbi:MAG: hypothetical protein JWP75_265 [Frondihabitans sp.]|nr:hypothetical protein [Frondihabitans sp.]